MRPVKTAFNNLLAFFGRELVTQEYLKELKNRPVSWERLERAQERIQLTLLRHQIASKWDAIDYVERELMPAKGDLMCPLCGHLNPVDEMKQFSSVCIFEGGNLTRYQCLACDLIFGPLKVLRMSPAQLAREYEWHYLAFSEGDSTEAELRAFHCLAPNRTGHYLNYGSGKWSTTVEKLREQGFDVIGYEPHQAASEKSETLITSRADLEVRRFDGIFSNNVLEHLQRPIEELRLMASILRPEGKIVHATPCFEYLYEYTRFHLFFYLGRSKAVLAELAGLELQGFQADGEFMYGTFAPKRSRN